MKGHEITSNGGEGKAYPAGPKGPASWKDGLAGFSDPRLSRIFILGLAILSLLMVSGCRLDMHIDPRYDPFSPSTFFPDGRSERPLVPGTVARGQLRTDELLYTGRINGQPANEFPFPITKADLKRGQQRYDIYCTPCHDYTGSGEGMIVRRGFPAPPSYHTAKLMNAPAGHLFDVMTNGYGTMYSYADRVSVKDRWRIAAYIRALQLSQDATLNDVPANERLKLMTDKEK
ncbi:MAG TPA: cytochrome c [Terriglobia bacterium]|nr:cytochrome c [Terriglobia bacterium]